MPGNKKIAVIHSRKAFLSCRGLNSWFLVGLSESWAGRHCSLEGSATNGENRVLDRTCIIISIELKKKRAEASEQLGDLQVGLSSIASSDFELPSWADGADDQVSYLLWTVILDLNASETKAQVTPGEEESM